MTEEKKYNINLNPKKPSKEEIRKKMDFEGAYQAYTHKAYRSSRARFQRHSFKNRKTTMFIILFSVVAMLVFMESEKDFENEIQQEEKKELNTDSINPSLKPVPQN